MKIYKINVTVNDIKYARRGAGAECPIALSAHRHKGLRKTRVGLTIIYNMSKVRKIPNVARDFISDFDAGRPVKPFSFEIQF